MKLHSVAPLFVAAVLLVSFSAFSESPAERAAVDSANHWLALVDAGKYAASWDVAAQLFKDAVAKDDWTKKVTKDR